MRPVALLLCATMLCACTTDRTATPDRSAAGTWTLAVTPTGSTQVASTAILIATSDTVGWSLTLPNRAPLPLRVAIAGDSFLVVTPPYESLTHTGVSAFDSTVYRLVGDSLVGRTVTHVSGAGPDLVGGSRSAGVRVRNQAARPSRAPAQ